MTDQKTTKSRSNTLDQAAPLPDPAEFRAWLRSSLTVLGLSPSAYGPELGLGKNTLGHFLGGGDRDLRLGTAAMIARDLQARANEKHAALDPVRSGCA